jgi:transglutaminase-like putative cysteine protease
MPNSTCSFVFSPDSSGFVIDSRVRPRRTRRGLFVGVLLLAATSTAGIERQAVAEDSWRREARPLLKVGISDDVKLSADGAAIELAVGRLHEDDGPSAGYSYQPNLEVLDDKVRIRKQLEIDDPRAAETYLLLGGSGKFEAVVNGRPQVLESKGRVANTWEQYAIPNDLLRPGVNDLVIHGTGKILIARDDERPPGESPPPNRSAKSRDGGATWDDAVLGKKDDFDGEYYVRIYLEQHLARGTYTSPVVDAANLAESPLAKPVGEIGPVRIRAAADVAESTQVAMSFRSGTTLAVDEEHWTAWQPLSKLDDLATSPRGRFVQVRVELSTSDPRRTPRLRELTISAEPKPAADWTAQARVVEAPAGRVVRSSIPFQFEAPDHPRLQQLRKQYKLDDVVAGAKTEWEKILKLAAWSGVQWQKRTGHLGEAYPKWDALEILAKHTDGTPIGGFCQHYNLVFLQACESLGIRGRPVSLGPGIFKDRIRSGHEVVELWSNNYGKWVHVDGDAARYYVDVKTRMPLSLRELHDRQMHFFLGRPFDPVEAVNVAETRPAWNSFADTPPFVELRLIPRANFLEQPTPVPLNQGMSGWSWPGHYAWTDADVVPGRLYDHRVVVPANWDWTLNSTDVRLSATDKPGEVVVQLDTVTPGFAGYEATVDEGPPQAIADGHVWKLHAGKNRLVVASRNETTRGIPTTAVLEWQP